MVPTRVSRHSLGGSLKNLRKIVRDVCREVLPLTTCKDLSEVPLNGAFLKFAYKDVMRDAVMLRRKGYAPNRANALEQAYDFALAKATKNEWIRTGEVFIDKIMPETTCIRAFCVENLSAENIERREYAGTNT